MVRLRMVGALGPLIASTLLITGTVRAITLPDTGSCTSGALAPCLKVTNNGTGVALLGETSSTAGFSRGVYGRATSGAGVVGESSIGTGVDGTAGSGIGVYGSSGSNNGVRAVTNSPTNAAVSAITPNANGLAYWGHGGIQLSGSFAEKTGGSMWTGPSDARIKRDVKDLPWGLEELRRIRPVTFKYNGLGGTVDDGRVQVGVIAQELERVFPSMVSIRNVRLNKEDAKDTDIRLVDPSAFTYVLISAVKEQQALIERQGALIERQGGRIASLEKGRASIAASILDSGVGTWLAMGLLPLAFVALRRRKNSIE
jgi:hypothetical protein